MTQPLRESRGPTRSSGSIDLSALSGRITFSKSTDDIWPVNANGSGLQRLTTDPANDFDPGWSPDGTKVAFMSQEPGASGNDPDYNIYVMNADGSDQHRITDRFAQFADWSPDGPYLVFAPGLNIIRPDGSGLISLRVGGGEPEFPDWTAQGRVGRPGHPARPALPTG